MSERRTFPSRPASVRAARHFALDALGDAPDVVVEAVAIAVSELATNCVLHAGTEFTVAVERSATEVRVEVSDRGRGAPTMRTPDATEMSGRGLLLVGELADEWGVDPADDDRPGKSVWFSMTLPANADAAFDRADR